MKMYRSFVFRSVVRLESLGFRIRKTVSLRTARKGKQEWKWKPCDIKDLQFCRRGSALSRARDHVCVTVRKLLRASFLPLLICKNRNNAGALRVARKVRGSGTRVVGRWHCPFYLETRGPARLALSEEAGSADSCRPRSSGL